MILNKEIPPDFNVWSSSFLPFMSISCLKCLYDPSKGYEILLFMIPNNYKSIKRCILATVILFGNSLFIMF